MDRVVRLRPDLSAQLLAGTGVFLLGPRQRFLLRGRAYECVVPRLDGRRSVSELVDLLSGELSPPEVLYTVETLLDRGYATRVVPGPPPPHAAFWHAQDTDAGDARRRLAERPVRVVALDGLDDRDLVADLVQAGASLRRDAARRIVLAGDYLSPALAAAGREAHESGAEWLLVKPVGLEPWIGPIFTPGSGPCLTCLADRLRRNRPVDTFLARRTGVLVPAGAFAGLPAGTRAALALAAVAATRWLGGRETPPLYGRLVSLALDTLALEEHTVVRRPQCPDCGDPDLFRARAEAPVRLEPAPKVFTADGGHRAATPEDTLGRNLHQVSRLTGIVAALGPVPGRDHPLRPVWATSWFACPSTDAPSFAEFDHRSMGKGHTVAQARASAFAEAVERWSYMFQGDEPVVRTSFEDLGDGAIHPDDLQNFSAAQRRDRPAINAAARDERGSVTPPYLPGASLSWTPVWSLTGERRRWVPTGYCYANFPAPEEERFCLHNPSGHAAGNCLEEAVLQGFLELVERDAVGLWWYSRAVRPAVDLTSFDEPYLIALVAHYRSLGYQVHALDLTTDLGIATLVALAYSESAGRFTVGFGAHLDARIAALRAVTEMNQIFDPAGRQPPPWDAKAIAEPSFLFPRSGAALGRADLPDVRHDDLADDVRWCVARAAERGLETLVLDQTRPDVGVSAVKVIVPGLRHFWPRLGPGRLYDVPVRLGWVPRALGENELNPIPLLL